MGFMSSISKTLTGGSSAKSSSNSQSGFALLPQEIQSVYKNYATDLNNQFAGGKANDLFTPLPQTEFETSGLNAIQRGVTATPESLSADIGMQMNPFDDYVIDDINRQAGGDYSILKTAANEAGQMGSNRQMLGANDIDTTRLNLIGKFKQDQYNKALDNSLNQLTASRQQDITNNFDAGEFLRGLDTTTKQAPINAMTSFGQLLGILPTSGGSNSTSSSKSESTNGMGDIISAGAALFSDKRLKENVEKVGEEKGFNIYAFNYIWSPIRYVGVMAQEVKKKMPEAVGMRDGFLTVDYDKLGLKMGVA